MNDPNQPAPGFGAPPGAPPGSAPAAPPKKKSRVLLFVGVGCLSLITMCCCTGGGLAWWRTNDVDKSARHHAEYFLSNVQSHEWDQALASSEYMGDTALYSSAQMQSCFMDTPLGNMSSYFCSDADGALWDDDRDVTCTVQTFGQGPQEITIHVNSADGAFPYLGFVWFSPTATFGTEWSSDNCARWSGRDYFDEPPANRVRPQAMPTF